MVRLGGVLCCVVAASGCDKVLGLQENSPPTRDANACMPIGPGDADDDLDGVINDLDRCPRVAHEEPNNEDADDALDACDLCPQLAGTLAGGDDDCDGLGAACDPQPMSPNERRFFGFGDQTGLTLHKAVVTDGLVRMTATNADKTNELFVQEPGALPARFEVKATITNARVVQYWSYEIVLRTGDGRQFEIQLEKHLATHTLVFAVEEDGATTDIGRKSIGTLATEALTFTLVVIATPTHLRGEVDIDGLGLTVAEGDATIGPLVSYGVTLNRDENTVVTETTAESPYFIYTLLLP